MSEAILRNVRATLQVTFYSGGSATSADGDVTVEVTGVCAGTATVASGTAVAAGTASPGVYTYALDPQTELDLLTTTWTGEFGAVAQSVQTITEVQGAFHVASSELRALPSLSSESTFPQARLESKRRVWEYLSETYCGVAFVPRYARDVYDGDGGNELWLTRHRARSLRSVTVDGTAVSDLSEFYIYPTGKLARQDGGSFTSGYRNVVVCYEHGYDLPTPDVKEAALKVIEELVLGDRTGVPSRAETMRVDIGTIELGTLPPFAVRVLNDHIEDPGLMVR